MVKTIGVLALQGNFKQHSSVLKQLGQNVLEVRNKSELNQCDALIIPGGESTTMSLLINTFNIYKPLVSFGMSNPVMGTCAGLIMMARDVADKRVDPLGLLDVVVDRNAYGRQIESSTELVAYRLNSIKLIELTTTFIRAPKISKVGKKILILGEFKSSPVAVLSGHHLGLSFHPELHGIDIFHQILFDNSSQYYYKNFNQVYET